MKNRLSKKLTLNSEGEHLYVHVFRCTGMLNGFLGKQKWFRRPSGKESKERRVLATTHFHSTAKSKKLADVYFSLENISIDTVSHEAVHFGTGVMLLNGIKSVSLEEPGEADEEKLAIYVGTAAQRMADFLYSII